MEFQGLTNEKYVQYSYNTFLWILQNFVSFNAIQPRWLRRYVDKKKNIKSNNITMQIQNKF